MPISYGSAFDVFKNHQLIMNALRIAISINNLLSPLAIAKGVPPASTFKCKQYHKEHFDMVDPTSMYWRQKEIQSKKVQKNLLVCSLAEVSTTAFWGAQILLKSL